MSVVIAKYNMSFDKGSFKKGQMYKYRQDKEDMFYVMTEENKEQDFYFPEFDTLFFKGNDNHEE